MKQFLSLLTAFGLAVIAASAMNTYLVIVPGPSSTTTNVAVNGTNYQNGVLGTLNTNWFNFSSSFGAQPNTNLWPAASWATSGYPGTQAGPSTQQHIVVSGILTAAQASKVSTVGVQFAYSDDGIVWVTNACTVQAATASGGTNFIGTTNWNIGAIQYVALQEVDNTNATTITNLYVTVFNKAGF